MLAVTCSICTGCNIRVQAMAPGQNTSLETALVMALVSPEDSATNARRRVTGRLDNIVSAITAKPAMPDLDANSPKRPTKRQQVATLTPACDSVVSQLSDLSHLHTGQPMQQRCELVVTYKVDAKFARYWMLAHACVSHIVLYP